MTVSSMHRLVRDLYKRFLLVAKVWPDGEEVLKNRVKEAFFRNKDLTNEEDISKAVYRGRMVVKELQGIIQMKKYRTMKQRYYGGFAPEQPNTEVAEGNPRTSENERRETR